MSGDDVQCGFSVVRVRSGRPRVPNGSEDDVRATGRTTLHLLQKWWRRQERTGHGAFPINCFTTGDCLRSAVCSSSPRRCRDGRLPSLLRVSFARRGATRP